MNIVKLNRYLSDNQGTLGKLTYLDFTCYTLELPWRDNASGKSCIPEGQYKVIWSLSPRLKKYTYAIIDIPNRAGIRIHGGNMAGDESKGYMSHSLGCPLLGLSVGIINNQRGVLGSRRAVANFERLMDKQPFILEIKNV